MARAGTVRRAIAALAAAAGIATAAIVPASARAAVNDGTHLRLPRGFGAEAGLEPIAAPGPAAITDPALAAALAADASVPGPDTHEVLTSRRAQILLRSLTLPGWGQATLGRRTSATVFALIETGVWGSFVAFQIQDRLRTESYERSARLNAGIDLSGRDEEFRRIVGSFLSSDEYNLLVVARDAANQFYDDPVRMQAYIDSLSLRGADAWAWSDVESLLRYRSQRKDAQRAQQRANTALAVAVANRLVSVLHAARSAGREEPRPSGWRLEVLPDPADWTALRLGVRTRF